MKLPVWGSGLGRGIFCEEKRKRRRARRAPASDGNHVRSNSQPTCSPTSPPQLHRDARHNGVDNAPLCFDFACIRPEPMMNRLSQFCALGATFTALSGCGTVTDLLTSNLPERYGGRPSIVVHLREQEAY